jgi:hypothetical protein
VREWFGRGFRRQGTKSSARRIERPGYTLWIFGGAVARFDECVYVEVRLSDGGGWGAALYTPEGVRAVLAAWRRVGGEHSGLYFWAPGVILIRELAPSERIVALVEDLMAEDELELEFVPLEHDRHAP